MATADGSLTGREQTAAARVAVSTTPAVTAGWLLPQHGCNHASQGMAVRQLHVYKYQMLTSGMRDKCCVVCIVSVLLRGLHLTLIARILDALSVWPWLCHSHQAGEQLGEVVLMANILSNTH